MTDDQEFSKKEFDSGLLNIKPLPKPSVKKSKKARVMLHR